MYTNVIDISIHYLHKPIDAMYYLTSLKHLQVVASRAVWSCLPRKSSRHHINTLIQTDYLSLHTTFFWYGLEAVLKEKLMDDDYREV
jgi:hypothetical protein